MSTEKEAISLDVLGESLNLGLGHVIDELSSISGSRIELHVPKVNMLPKADALNFADRMRQAGKAIFVQQKFSGDITGEALMFFSESESLNLLNGILDDTEEQRIEFAATEEEMLLDLTNVAVSGVIYALSSMLELSVETDLPLCEYGYYEDIQTDTTLLDDADEYILFLEISFTVVKQNSTAQLMFFQRKDEMDKLFDHIQKKLGF